MATPVNFDPKELESKVKAMYRSVAENPHGEFHFEMGRAMAERLGYAPADLDRIPKEAIDSFAGVGYYFHIADLKEGETVIDPDGEKFVVMNQGRRYDGSPGLPDFQIVDFERYGLLIGNQSQNAAGERSARALQMNELVAKNDGYARGELLWRIALPFMALTLMLLAIPLSFVNPRAGRSLGLLVALLLFVVYSNTVSVFQASVAQGRATFMMAWWPVHVVVVVLIVGMFALRLNINHPYHPSRLWSRVRRAMTFQREA